jgi:osmotically-inducible protein OsmY
MQQRRRRLAIASIAALAGIVAVGELYVRHRHDSAPARQHPLTADSFSGTQNISAAINASLQKTGVPLEGVTVTWMDGIVILRGTASSKEAGERIADGVHAAGYGRVANLIRVTAAPDDYAIQRDAERQLTRSRSLTGCKFSVTATKGVLKVGGVIPSDTQEAAAREILKNVHGPREVHAEFTRF